MTLQRRVSPAKPGLVSANFLRAAMRFSSSSSLWGKGLTKPRSFMSPFFYFPAETSPAAVRPYGCLSSLKLDRLSHGAGMSLKRLRVLHPVDLTALADDDLFSPNDLP